MPDRLARVAILGTGLIGGSLGLALKQCDLAQVVCGYDLDSAHARRALERGAIDEVAASPEACVAGAQLVAIAVPVRSIPKLLAEIAPHLADGALVTDMGSTKASIVRTADAELPSGVSFVGGHPMAGSELDGVEAADASLFVNCCYVLTPAKGCSPDAFSLLHRLIQQLGALVVVMEPEQHDRAVGMVSHLPHSLSLSLMRLALRKQQETANLFYLAAGGFRDMTRIAASNPDIWVDILTENADAVCALIDDFSAELTELRRLIERGDAPALAAYMREARTGRRDLTPLARAEGDLFELSIPMDDRPGVISRITEAIGGLQINIADLELVHPLDSGRGLLRVLVQGEEEARRAAAALQEKGLTVRFGARGVRGG
ncbi:MAG: prephenate dehydrogenase/arogenate dehydrogenase family protein [Candidatus Geothermincolia bacterium]